MEEINGLLYGLLKGVADVYPTVADIEKASHVRMPYAVYRVSQSGERTKERVRRSYETTIAVVARTYAEAQSVTERVDAALEGLDRRMYSVSPATTEMEYDLEDRAYVGTMSFTIKRLTS